MNHSQLKRMSAYNLLCSQGLLQPLAASTHQYNAAITNSFVKRGWSLIRTLTETYKLEMFSTPPTDPLLQGSLATFDPYDPDDHSAGGTICYRRDLGPEEQLFAIAHEFAHFILHRGQNTTCHKQDLELTDSDNSPLSGQVVEVYNPHNLKEREANLFALELLMPHSEVRNKYSELIADRPQGRSGRPSVVEELAQYFGVTPYRMLMQLSTALLTPPLPTNLENSAEVTSQDRPTSIQLDEDQQRAVEIPTPALVMAGPGTGKTRTLVERVRYLVKVKGISLKRLLVLTFSNKAAGELRERLAQIGLPIGEMNISTFHTYGLDLLRRHAERAGLARDFRLLDPAHAYMLMEDILIHLPTGYYIRENNPNQYLQDLLGDISRAKDYLRTPEDYQAAVDSMQEEFAESTGQIQPPFKIEDVERATERAAIFNIYETQKQQRKLVDFGDLVMLPVQLLVADAEVRQEEQNRYDEILVDEFQDINYASGQLLQLLAGPRHGGRGNIWAVGDIHQSIYRFRGAFPQQAGPKAFQEVFSGDRPVNILELSYNYRSLPAVVALANHLRSVMPEEGATRPLQAKRMSFPSDKNATQLFFNEFNNSSDEAASIIASIEEHRHQGWTYSDQAILCQRHAQADDLARTLTAAGIPVTRLGQFFNRAEIQECLAMIEVLNHNTGLGLVRLSQERLTILKFLELAHRNKITPRQALRDSKLLAQLDSSDREELARIAELLESLTTRRSIWRLLAEYLFEWSPLVAHLLGQEENQAERQSARQSLGALYQLLRIAGTFDREEEDKLYRATERSLGHALSQSEQEEIRRQQLHPTQQRRGFLHYRNALVQSDTRVEMEEEQAGANDSVNPPSTETGGAVKILTAHTSKGLEFPFVYLPGLHATKLPKSVTEPAPPGLYRDQLEGPEYDARCLFYVSVTRAMNKLHLSWALSDKAPDSSESEEVDGVVDSGVGGKSDSKTTKKPKTRSPREVLEPALEHRQNNPEMWGELKVVLVETLPQNEVKATAPAKFNNQTIPTPASDNGLLVIDYWAIKKYLKCPSAYYYKYVLKGQAATSDSKSNLYAGLNQAQRQLHLSLQENEVLPALETLLESYNKGWQHRKGLLSTGAKIVKSETVLEQEPLAEPEEESSVADYYQQQGAKIVEKLWNHHEDQAVLKAIPENNSSTIVARECDQPQQEEFPNSIISFKIDRVETLSDGSKRLIRSQIGYPALDAEKLDSDDYELLTLYALAHPTAPGAPPNEVIIETLGQYGVHQLTADKAYKKAEDHQRWKEGKLKREGLLVKLDRAALGIKAGRFEPKPGEQCLRCPFYTIICPIKPQ